MRMSKHGTARLAPAGVLLGSLLLAIGPALPSGATASTETSVPFFSLVKSPNANALDDNVLNGVATFGTADETAVGSFVDTGHMTQALILQRDSAGVWTVVTPDGQTTNNEWLGVAGTSVDDKWAVGYTTDGSGVKQASIAHFDGTDWTGATPPSEPGGDNVLYGVTAIAPDDAWAVGSATDGDGVKQRLIEHFDGATWKIDRSLPGRAEDTVLNAVSAVASGDLWAVGYGTSGGTKETLAVHFDGSSWTPAGSANPESGDNVLTGAAMVSATEGFASGYGVDASGVEHAVTESFNGTAWVPADLGDVGSGDNRLLAVSATGASDVWVAGFSTSTAGVKRTEVQHFDGTGWTVATTQNAGSQDNVLNGIAARSATDVWAAGSSIPSGDSSSQTLVERDNGTQPKKLTVAKVGAGSGTVISSPAGIDCGATCSFSFASGTQVVLTATPGSGSTFGGWSGACTGTGSCTVTMDQARSVTATFDLATSTPTPTATPSGGVQTGGGGTAGRGFPMLAAAVLIGLLGAAVVLRIARRA